MYFLLPQNAPRRGIGGYICVFELLMATYARISAMH